MPRKADPGRREELEAALAAYILAHGVAALSLREVATALNISTYPLVYHFGSKDGLVAAALARVEERQREMVAAWARDTPLGGAGELLRRYWAWVSRAELFPYHRLYFEVYGLALREPRRFPGFLARGGAEPWTAFVRDTIAATGLPEGDADRLASLLIATVAGTLLGLLTDHDHPRAARTIDAVATAIEQRPPPPG